MHEYQGGENNLLPPESGAEVRNWNRGSRPAGAEPMPLPEHESDQEFGVVLWPEEEARQDALLAFHLVAVAPLPHQERLNIQALLLARLRLAIPGFPGVNRAIELRYLVHPPILATGELQRLDCYLLARFTDWRLAGVDLASAAQAFGHEVAQLLATTVPSHVFHPLSDPQAILAVLRPFPLADMAEVRQDDIIAGPLPGVFGGVPDVDLLMELMARQDTPTLLTFCLEPVEMESALNALDGIAPSAEQWPTLESGQEQDERIASALVPRQEAIIEQQRFTAQRLAAFRRQVFRLRIQLAGAAPLGESLLGTLTAEVGGPSRLLAQAAWQNPASPIAGSATVVHPHTSKIQGLASEEEIATANLQGLTFMPWGDHLRALSPYLVDLSEAARLFALPSNATWLDARAIALGLPFRESIAAGLRLGVNHQQQGALPVLIPQASRTQHMWIVGQTGTGKSSLLESLVLQDIHAGRGVIVIDPHGELITQIQTKIPAHRAEDVIIFDPADSTYPLGVNLLEAHTEDEQAMVVSSFIGLLRKLFDPHELGIVGPRFEHSVRNGLLTVMSLPGGGTLVELMRVLTDDRFMRAILPHVTDPIVRRYWEDQIAHTQDFHRSEVLDYVVSKFGPFVTDFTLRRIVGQVRNSFRFREAMDQQKIVLLSLAKGRLGSTNANFLGLILLPMILQATLSRAQLPPDQRKECILYIDEFQNYATDSLALMLAESRKYHLGLVLANQHVGQMTGEIRDAVLGNVGSIIAFRLGAADALAMEQILAPSPVGAQHLINLPNYTAYCRLLIAGKRSAAFTLQTELSPYPVDLAMPTILRDYTRTHYGRPRAQVDAEIAERSQMTPPPPRPPRTNDISDMADLFRTHIRIAPPPDDEE